MITDEPVRGSFAYLEHPWLLSLSGLEQFRPFMKGQVPYAPLYHLAGLEVVEVGPGSATWTMPASPWWQTSAGVFCAGVFPFVADAALGTAIYTTLPPKKVLTTSQLTMEYLRPPSVESGHLIARAKVVQVGRSQGLSECTVEDSRGMLLAHGASRCVLLDVPFEPPPPPDTLPAPRPIRPEPDDPVARPVEGRPLDAETLLTRRWIELDEAVMRGELPYPPLCNFTGMTVERVEEGSVTYRMPASRWFCAAGGTFYGGASAMLLDAAMTGAVGTTLDAGDGCATLDDSIYFLRPVVPDGRPPTATARVTHRGRSIAVVTADVVDDDGRRVATATGSSMVVADGARAWARHAAPAQIDQPQATESEQPLPA